MYRVAQSMAQYCNSYTINLSKTPTGVVDCNRAGVQCLELGRLRYSRCALPKASPCTCISLLKNTTMALGKILRGKAPLDSAVHHYTLVKCSCTNTTHFCCSLRGTYLVEGLQHASYYCGLLLTLHDKALESVVLTFCQRVESVGQ